MGDQRALLAALLREDRLDYTPFAGSVQLARRRVARLLCEWGHPDVAGDVALVVSELAGNAVLHGSVRGRFFRVHLMLTASVVRVEVTDPRGERRVRRREAGDEEMFGRGLAIVEALVSRWGVLPRTVGKTVWAECDLR